MNFVEKNCGPLLGLSLQNANKNICTHLFFHFFASLVDSSGDIYNTTIMMD
jgi:hypothetical protein